MPVYTAARARPLLKEIPEVQALAAAPPAQEGKTGLAARLAPLPEPEQDQAILALVRGHAAAVLGYESPDAIEPDCAFRELGFDSLTAVELPQSAERRDRTAAARHDDLRLCDAGAAGAAGPRGTLRAGLAGR